MFSRYSGHMKGIAWLAIAGVIALTVAVDLRLAPWVQQLVKQLPGRDTTGHIVLFGALSFLVNIAFARVRLRGRELGVPICTGLLLGAITLEEYSQKFIPRRDFSETDLAASYAGALLCAGIAWAVLARQEVRRAAARVS